jgi:hypothetical protein
MAALDEMIRILQFLWTVSTMGGRRAFTASMCFLDLEEIRTVMAV